MIDGELTGLRMLTMNGVTAQIYRAKATGRPKVGVEMGFLGVGVGLLGGWMGLGGAGWGWDWAV